MVVLNGQTGKNLKGILNLSDDRRGDDPCRCSASSPSA